MDDRCQPLIIADHFFRKKVIRDPSTHVGWSIGMNQPRNEPAEDVIPPAKNYRETAGTQIIFNVRASTKTLRPASRVRIPGRKRPHEDCQSGWQLLPSSAHLRQNCSFC